MSHRRICLAVALVVLAAMATGCGRGRVIPKDKFSDIYADMLLADQWLSSNSRARRTADTSRFYEPIFEKYGYSLKDYDASVKHYMKKPATFSKILDASSAKLTAYADRLQAVEDELKNRVKFSQYVPENFNRDSLIFKDRHVWPQDSLFIPKPAAIDTAALDSTAVDSLAVDSLFTDSLKVDSLKVDSLKVDSAKVEKPAPDSLKQIIEPKQYDTERKTDEMLLIHGSDDPASGRHRVKREITGHKSNQASH